MSRDLDTRRRYRTGLLAFAVVGLAFMIGALGIGACVIAAGDGPRPATEGKDWTHKELVAYLDKKGIELRVADRHDDDPNGPIVDYWTPDGTHTFRVQRCATADKAKELAGTNPAGTAFSWGRFRITTGGGSFHQTIRKALPD
jgi:hypothetical protein